MRADRWKNIAVSVLLVWMTSTPVAKIFATHLRAGEIYAEQVDGCSSKTFRITIVVYLNSQSSVLFGGVHSFLDFGDGTSVNVPDDPNPEIIDAKLHISKATFVTIHRYILSGPYLISYSEMNRNADILNMTQSILTPFHIETQITVDPHRCVFSPIPQVPPIDRACLGVAFLHDASAIAGDDSLSYQLITPLSAIGQTVHDFVSPADPKFYLSLDYNNANENHDSIPTITINPLTGLLVWDAPGFVGEYGIAIKISSWRKNTKTGVWEKTGYTIRDMQILVGDCNNRRPSLTAPEDICASPTHPADFMVSGTDPDQDSVSIEAFSEAFLLKSNPAVVTPAPTQLQPFNNAHAHFTWNVDCKDVRSFPYIVVFKLSDHPASGPPLVDFKNVSIRVVADPPDLNSLQYNSVGKRSTLQWTPYPCSKTASIQVWRRVTKIDYNQSDCDFGMHASLNYTLIAELPPDATSYTDVDIHFGPQYCYRILAVVGDRKTPSRLSVDTCFIAAPVGTSIITETSVQKTDSVAGMVRVSWTPPINIDSTEYPPPYTYELFRRTSHTFTMTKLHTGLMSDTTFLDVSGNTLDSTYLYQVLLHSASVSAAPIDYSDLASTVRLEKKAELDGIRLTWSAMVPWSNALEKYPYHYIYRSTSGTEGSFILIDSVNVVEDGNTYFDRGSGGPLVPGQRYYYKVETVGGFGNPELPEPLLNLSQIVGTPIQDTIPPCAPVLSIFNTDCTTIPCDQLSFSNTLRWNPCGVTAAYYQVYAASNPDSTYTRIADHVDGLSYVDKDLSERARCYKIVSVNEFDIPSDFSNIVVAENCTGFTLPNVFTPGLTLGQNDIFKPFGVDQNEEGEPDPSTCYRSVVSMAMNIYDRWGKVIFSGSSADGTPVTWSGKNNNGQEAAAGTYYYAVRVNFRLSSWKQESRIYKGWVQVLK